MGNKMKKWLAPILALLIGAFAINVLSLYVGSFCYSEEIFASYWKEPVLILFNFIPIAVTTVALAFLLSSMRWSMFINTFVWVGIALTNRIVLELRHMVFKPTDVELLPSAIRIIPRYISAVPGICWVIALVFLGFILLTSWQLPKIKLTMKERIAGLLIPLILFGIVLVPVYGNFKLYYQLGKKSNLEIWIDNNGFMSKGLAYPFVYKGFDAFKKRDKHIDTKAAEKILAGYQEKDLPAGKKPHIIGMMLESFKDFSDLPITANFTRDPYAAFHEIEKEALRGRMIANIYGGGTFTTESQFLTANPEGPKVKLPHESYASYFHKQGYLTEAFHPNDGEFYNRFNFYPKAGFDGFYDSKNYLHNPNGNAISADKDFFPELYKRFLIESRKGPYFQFSVTLQNHGPYFKDRLVNGSYFTQPKGMSTETYNYLNNYFNGICHTGEALRWLTDQLKDYPEPVIFIFFGDHSPSVPNDGYLGLGLSNPKNPVENLQIKQATPFCIWANEAAKKAYGKSFVGEMPDSSPSYMMSRLWDYLGWDVGTPYQQFRKDSMKDFSVVFQNFKKISEGYTQTLTSEQQKRLESIQNVNLYNKHQKDAYWEKVMAEKKKEEKAKKE